MSALGHKQTFAVRTGMSALPQKRTCAPTCRAIMRVRQRLREVSSIVAYTKAFPKQNDVKRGLDAARKSPVPVRSVDFIRPDGSRVSFIMDNATKTDTDPVTTITESELKDLI